MWRVTLPLHLFQLTCAAQEKKKKESCHEPHLSQWEFRLSSPTCGLRAAGPWRLQCQQCTCCQQGFLTARASWHEGRQDLHCDTAGSSTELRSLLTSIHVTFIFWTYFPPWLWWMHEWYSGRGLCCCWESGGFWSWFWLWCCSPMRSLIRLQATVNYRLVFVGEHEIIKALLFISVHHYLIKCSFCLLLKLDCFIEKCKIKCFMVW